MGWDYSLGNPIDLAKASSRTFLDELLLRYPREALLTCALCFGVTFLLFASLSPNALPNGDAAVYLQQIENHDFSSRSVHVGYYLLGVVFTSLLPGPNDYALNLMSGFFGAGTISLIYLMGYSITRSRLAAILASLFLATNYLFVFNAIYAEVYVVHTFFIILAWFLWLFQRPVLTGLSFIVAFLVTPTALFAAPSLIILRPEPRSLAILGATV